jgi:hypothetical protein
MERARAALELAGCTSQTGKDAVALKPLQLERMGDEDGRGRSRPEHSGSGNRPADEAVDESRLARSGRAAEDREQRSIQLTKAGQEIVVDLADELALRLSSTFAAEGVEGEFCPAQLGPERHHRVVKLLGIHVDSVPTLTPGA